MPLAYITGASSGIGQAMAISFYRRGFRLALNARRGDAIEAWASQAGWEASRYQVFAADVRDVNAITAAGRACIEQMGLPDVVVANAGISVGIDSAVLEDLETMRTVYETNNIGMAATFQPFLQPMAARGSGLVVGIASVAGIRGLPGHAAYCSSKAAVISYCESLRGELRGSGVGVVTLVPGYVDTPLTRKNRYPMPFLMPAEAFGERAVATILARRSYRVIPWPMAIVARLLRALPNAWFDRLLVGRPRKARGGG